MARLSQRGMNNVVIVAMLIMIALFNLNSFLPKSKEPDIRPLIPSGAYILKLEQQDNRLERSGQQWRQVSSKGALPVSAREQLTEWQQAQLKSAPLLDNAFELIDPIIVVIWLAGQVDGQVYAFYPNTNPVTVKYNNNWYTLENARLDVLLPWLSESTN